MTTTILSNGRWKKNQQRTDGAFECTGLISMRMKGPDAMASCGDEHANLIKQELLGTINQADN